MKTKHAKRIREGIWAARYDMPFPYNASALTHEAYRREMVAADQRRRKAHRRLLELTETEEGE